MHPKSKNNANISKIYHIYNIYNMAELKYKKQIDLVETLRSFEPLESMRFTDAEIKKTTFRALFYQYKSEGLINGTFSIISVPNTDEYIVTRTA